MLGVCKGGGKPVRAPLFPGALPMTRAAFAVPAGRAYEAVPAPRATSRPGLLIASPGLRAGGSPLRLARLAAGLTAADLARAVHVARTTVSVWERAQRGVARHYWPALGAALRLEPDEVAALFADYPPARLDCVRLPSLARVRRAAGLRQRTLAELVGVAPTTLSMWECAAVPVSLSVAHRLARLLGADLPLLTSAPAAPGPDPRPLRRLRLAARMSRREAAAQLGISVGSLSRYEAGERRAPVAVLRRMAAAYGRPVSELLQHGGCQVLPLPPRRWRPEQVPAALTALRIGAGLSKVGLGRLVRRSGQAVAGWESGRCRPSSATCRRLETIYGLPAGRLPY